MYLTHKTSGVKLWKMLQVHSLKYNVKMIYFQEIVYDMKKYYYVNILLGSVQC